MGNGYICRGPESVAAGEVNDGIGNDVSKSVGGYATCVFTIFTFPFSDLLNSCTIITFRGRGRCITQPLRVADQIANL